MDLTHIERVNEQTSHWEPDAKSLLINHCSKSIVINEMSIFQRKIVYNISAGKLCNIEELYYNTNRAGWCFL